MMLRDAKRTKFVVVCIAEYLSISETRRLLQELARHEVAASNVVVNQLIKETISAAELADLHACLPKSKSGLAEKIEAVSALSNARNSIQQKYLNVLKTSKEAHGLGIIEVPLLPSEITGPSKLLEFSLHLIPRGYRSTAECQSGPTMLIDRQERGSILYEDAIEDETTFMEGEKVVLVNLTKSPEYNGRVGEVVKLSEDGRVVIRIKDPTSGKFKVLSLRAENLESVSTTAFL
jgi:arsenite-transporting ATPase